MAVDMPGWMPFRFLRITAEVPGIEARELDLRIADGFLVLRGEKRVDGKQDEKRCYRLERAFGSFRRVLPPPRTWMSNMPRHAFQKCPHTAGAEEGRRRQGFAPVHVR